MWDLTAIRSKARKISGRLSANQLSDSSLDDYINSYYRFDFPLEAKLLNRYTFYTFTTTANAEKQAISSDYVVQSAPFTVDAQESELYLDPEAFYGLHPSRSQETTLATGDGVTTTFSSTLNAPVLKGSLVIFDGTETFTDAQGTSTLTGSEGGTGSFNYVSGSLELTFAAAPQSGASIKARYEVYDTGRPSSALFMNRELVFRPIPDSTYQVKIKVYKRPSALVEPTDTPENEEWGELIAYGAAIKIFEDNGDIAKISEVLPLYERQMKKVMNRSASQLIGRRSIPSF